MPYMKSVSFARRNSAARASGMIASAHRSVSAGSTVSNGASRSTTVDAEARPRAHLDVHVRGALLDGEPQQSIEIQHVDRGIDPSARLL